MMSVPALLSKMIDNGVAKSDEELIMFLAGGMIGLAAVGSVLNIAAARLAAKITTGFSARLRSEVFRKVQEFASAEIDRFSSASLITRSTSDVTTIQTFLSVLFRMGIFSPIMLIVGLILSVVTAGRIAVVLTVAIPVMLIGLGVVIAISASYSDKLCQKIDEINRLFLETLDGVRVIRAFNKQNYEILRFDKANGASRQSFPSNPMPSRVPSFPWWV